MSGKAKLWKCIAPTTWRGMMMNPGDEIHTEDPAFPECWEPVDGVWPEVKQEAKPEQAEGGSAGHWSDIPHDEVMDALRTFDTPDEFLRVLALGVAIAHGPIENAKSPSPDAVTGPAQSAQSAEASAAAEAPKADAPTGTTEAAATASGASAASEDTTSPATGRATARVKPGAKA